MNISSGRRGPPGVEALLALPYAWPLAWFALWAALWSPAIVAGAAAQRGAPRQLTP